MMRVVVDTGVLVSAFIRRESLPGQVLQALREGRFTILFSYTILQEIVEVLSRPEFTKKYHVQIEDIRTLTQLIVLRGEKVDPTQPITACRDAKDNAFLEAAVDGEADMIVSGDNDLLALDPFEGISILSPAAFLARLAGT